MTGYAQLRHRLQEAADDRARLREIFAEARNAERASRAKLDELQRERRRILVEGTDAELDELDERLEALRREADDLGEIQRAVEHQEARLERDDAKRERARWRDVELLLREAEEQLQLLPDLIGRVEEGRSALSSAEAALADAVQGLERRYAAVSEQRRGAEFPRISTELVTRLEWLEFQGAQPGRRVLSVRREEDRSLHLPLAADPESETADAPPGAAVGEVHVPGSR